MYFANGSIRGPARIELAKIREKSHRPQGGVIWINYLFLKELAIGAFYSLPKFHDLNPQRYQVQRLKLMQFSAFFHRRVKWGFPLFPGNL